MLKTFTTMAALLGSLAAHAHEFWILPDRFRPEPGAGGVSLTLSVGEDFQGERVAFSRPLVAQFLHVSRTGWTDLHPAVSPETRGDFLVEPRGPGTHLLALTTHPSESVLPADEFHAYLREDGLDAVLRQREASGQAAMPGRERYRRTIKTLLLVGDRVDRIHATRVGQALEIVPDSHPARHRPGQPLAFRVLYAGKPLGGALVKFWQRGAASNPVGNARTDARGFVRLAPASGGTWMVSVVHMVPARGTPLFDWDSYWANLTFELPVNAPGLRTPADPARRPGRPPAS